MTPIKEMTVPPSSQIEAMTDFWGPKLWERSTIVMQGIVSRQRDREDEILVVRAVIEKQDLVVIANDSFGPRSRTGVELARKGRSSIKRGDDGQFYRRQYLK
jgi:hypothetical protein